MPTTTIKMVKVHMTGLMRESLDKNAFTQYIVETLSKQEAATISLEGLEELKSQILHDDTNNMTLLIETTPLASFYAEKDNKLKNNKEKIENIKEASKIELKNAQEELIAKIKDYVSENFIETTIIQKTDDDIKKQKKREKNQRYRDNKKRKQQEAQILEIATENKNKYNPFPMHFGWYDIISCADTVTMPDVAQLFLKHKERQESRSLFLNLNTCEFLEKDIDFTGLHKKTHSSLIKTVASKVKEFINGY